MDKNYISSSEMNYHQISLLIDFVNKKKKEFDNIFEYLKVETYKSVQDIYTGVAAEAWLNSLNYISSNTSELLDKLLASIVNNFDNEVHSYKEMEEKLHAMQDNSLNS